MGGTSHTTKTETQAHPGVEKVGQYQATPVTLPDGSVTFLITDSKGYLISVIAGVDDDGVVQKLKVDHLGNLHVTHPHETKSVMVNEPGLAYANGVNALCIAAPSDEDHYLELVGIYLSTNAAGSFYLVVADLGLTPGTTTANLFDLVGVMGSDITDTCEVAWAAFLANQGRGVTGGNYLMDLMAGYELYLIAPNEDYHIHVNYLDQL